MKPRVTIACSGLGHVRRGSESWAQDLGELLGSQGHDVQLVGGAPLRTRAPYHHLRTVQRGSPMVAVLNERLRYVLEQALFTRALLAWLRRHPTDILHVSDPQVGWWLRREFWNSGPAVIYRDGLMLGPDWLWRFNHVQVLAPHYLELGKEAGADTSRWSVIPHFIDTDRFRPEGNRPADAAAQDGPVLLAVGDFAAGSHKRLDYVIGEVAQADLTPRPRLRIAGHARPADVRSLQQLGSRLLGDRFELLPNLSRDRLAEVYRTSDLLLHAALREPFGMVLLEAMSSGIPVLAHDFEVTRWVVGDGGETHDFSRPGAMAGAIRRVLGPGGWLADRARRARESVLRRFSPSAVLPLYEEAYQRTHRALRGPTTR